METKEIFRLLNTHLDHLGSEARKLGLEQILKKMEQESASDKVPAVLTGDFNAAPDSPELKIFKNYPQYIDLTTKIKGTFHDFGRLKIPEKIDYVVAQDNFTCTFAGTWEDCKEGVFLSDHYPVCVEIYTK
jgi:endonuclease/exonuclease/phosphatase family metal-dependent hydrolase